MTGTESRLTILEKDSGSPVYGIFRTSAPTSSPIRAACSINSGSFFDFAGYQVAPEDRFDHQGKPGLVALVRQLSYQFEILQLLVALKAPDEDDLEAIAIISEGALHRGDHSCFARAGWAAGDGTEQGIVDGQNAGGRVAPLEHAGRNLRQAGAEENRIHPELDELGEHRERFREPGN